MMKIVHTLKTVTHMIKFVNQTHVQQMKIARLTICLAIIILECVKNNV